MTQPLQIQPDHVQVVINALAARPWGEVNHVMVSLMGQMQQQQAPVTQALIANYQSLIEERMVKTQKVVEDMQLEREKFIADIAKQQQDFALKLTELEQKYAAQLNQELANNLTVQ